MRSALIFPILLAGIPVLAQEEVFPPAYTVDRYQEMMSESPFALATKVEAPTAPKDSFAKDWVLNGLSKIRDEQGVERDFVSIKSRDQTQNFSLYGSEPNTEGVSIASVERSPQVGKSKVTLKKGNEFAVVEFNQMEIEASIASPDHDGNQVRPLPGVRGPAANPQVNGRPQIPRPQGLPRSGGGVLPQPGNNQPQLNMPSAAPAPSAALAPGAVPAPGTAADVRKRIRVINSRP